MITQITDSSKFVSNLESRNENEVFYIFYHSPWDEQSIKLLNFIQENFSESKHNFLIADMFELPDSYTVLFPQRVPCLFIVSNTVKQQYIPFMIWTTLESMVSKMETSMCS